MMDGLSKRTPTADISKLPGSLPVANITQEVDHEAVAASCISKLMSLRAEDLTQNALWRDSFALTGTLRTFSSATEIETAWIETSSYHHPGKFTLKPQTSHIARFGPKVSWVEASLTFETEARPTTMCSGFISLIPDSKGGWKIWLLRTILEQLKGYGNVDVLSPQRDIANGIAHLTTSGAANAIAYGIKHETSNCILNGATDSVIYTSTQRIHSSQTFDCAVIGGGQAGLATGGHLKALGASYVILDRNKKVGDSWMLRYDCAKRNIFFLPFQFYYQSNANFNKFIHPESLVTISAFTLTQTDLTYMHSAPTV